MTINVYIPTPFVKFTDSHNSLLLIQFSEYSDFLNFFIFLPPSPHIDSNVQRDFEK